MAPVDPALDEPRLVEAARGGSLDAFNRLVLAHEEMAFNLAFRMLSDPAAAEDATQNAFISAYRSLGGFRGGSFRAWVLRMVTNACYDELRRRHRHPVTPLEPAGTEEDAGAETAAWMADDAPDPQARAEQAELGRSIQHCLNTLPPDYRAVVVLVDLEGMDYREAAQASGCPLGTIKSRLARARLGMRDCLRQFMELIPSEFRLQSEGRS